MAPCDNDAERWAADPAVPTVPRESIASASAEPPNSQGNRGLCRCRGGLHRASGKSTEAGARCGTRWCQRSATGRRTDMTTPIEILLAVGDIGGRLGIAGDKLRMLLPPDCPAELKDAIR